MFNKLLRTARLTGFALVASLGLASTAAAATIDFVVDRANSSVTLTSPSGGGFACTLSRCGVSAALAADLTTGDIYTIGTGTTSTFDFLTFTGRGTTGLSPRSYSISAVLAFSSPMVSINGSGTASAFLLAGNIIGGNLTWASITPQNWTSPNGSEVAFNFTGGTGLFLGRSVTTTASVTGVNIVAPVPLPAAGFMLIGALAGLGALRRRKAAIAA